MFWNEFYLDGFVDWIFRIGCGFVEKGCIWFMFIVMWLKLNGFFVLMFDFGIKFICLFLGIFFGYYLWIESVGLNLIIYWLFWMLMIWVGR